MRFCPYPENSHNSMWYITSIIFSRYIFCLNMSENKCKVHRARTEESLPTELVDSQKFKWGHQFCLSVKKKMHMHYEWHTHAHTHTHTHTHAHIHTHTTSTHARRVSSQGVLSAVSSDTYCTKTLAHTHGLTWLQYTHTGTHIHTHTQTHTGVPRVSIHD